MITPSLRCSQLNRLEAKSEPIHSAMRTKDYAHRSVDPSCRRLYDQVSIQDRPSPFSQLPSTLLFSSPGTYQPAQTDETAQEHQERRGLSSAAGASVIFRVFVPSNHNLYGSHRSSAPRHVPSPDLHFHRCSQGPRFAVRLSIRHAFRAFATALLLPRSAPKLRQSPPRAHKARDASRTQSPGPRRPLNIDIVRGRPRTQQLLALYHLLRHDVPGRAQG
ncbi:hypothetical protein C8Q80DRAFT_48717 [Daedaleopsis nitida]|nr:hypothetical protein C8Q80DRAFT_48717 [Daedaleopsis nitida]